MLVTEGTGLWVRNMGNHDTRHAGARERCEGTILFFSDKGCQAHIWCVHGPSPLCIALQSDYPDIWPLLSVGSVVSVTTEKQGKINQVTEMAFHASEPLDGDPSVTIRKR